MVLVLLTASRDGWAAACCGDGSSLGRRLTESETSASTLSLSYLGRFGGYSGDGTYRGLEKGDYDHTLRLEAGFTVRAASWLELGVLVPLQVDLRSLGGTSEQGGGFGDISAAARYQALRDPGDKPWPAIYFTATVVVPTGRPTELGSELGSSVTGQGVPELRGQIDIEKTFVDRWFAVVTGSASLFGGSDAGGVSITRSPRFAIGATTGPVFPLGLGRGLAAGIGVRYEAENAASIEGSTGGTGRTRFDLLASGALDLTRFVSLVSSFESELPVDHLGQNELARATFTLGVRLATGH